MMGYSEIHYWFKWSLLVLGLVLKQINYLLSLGEWNTVLLVVVFHFHTKDLLAKDVV